MTQVNPAVALWTAVPSLFHQYVGGWGWTLWTRRFEWIIWLLPKLPPRTWKSWGDGSGENGCFHLGMFSSGGKGLDQPMFPMFPRVLTMLPCFALISTHWQNMTKPSKSQILQKIQGLKFWLGWETECGVGNFRSCLNMPGWKFGVCIYIYIYVCISECNQGLSKMEPGLNNVTCTYTIQCVPNTCWNTCCGAQSPPVLPHWFGFAAMPIWRDISSDEEVPWFNDSFTFQSWNGLL